MKTRDNKTSPRRLPGGLILLLRFGLGLLIGLFVHYLFYRVALPVEPFIYVAF